MLTWFKNRVQNVKVWWAFIEYEQKARAGHMAAAERRFSSKELEDDRTERMRQPMAEAERRFSKPVEALGHQVAGLRSRLNQHQAQLQYFLRTYRDELDPLYREKDELIETCKGLREEKSQAYQDLESAVDSVDSWYSKSQGSWFGNAGKQLPKHSMFGQSFGDLDGYKSDRDAASDEISACKKALAGLSQRITEIKQQIGAIKADQRQMHELKKQGFTRGSLEREISILSSQLSRCSNDQQSMVLARLAFLEQARHRNGAAAIEIEITRINALKDAFIKSFDSEQAQSARRTTHRNQWLADRQR